MNAIARTWTKNLVVAATLGLAALATWAVTESPVPVIDASTLQAPQG